jgi:hypothetical protein
MSKQRRSSGKRYQPAGPIQLNPSGSSNPEAVHPLSTQPQLTAPFGFPLTLEFASLGNDGRRNRVPERTRSMARLELGGPARGGSELFRRRIVVVAFDGPG